MDFDYPQSFAADAFVDLSASDTSFTPNANLTAAGAGDAAGTSEFSQNDYFAGHHSNMSNSVTDFDDPVGHSISDYKIPSQATNDVASLPMVNSNLNKEDITYGVVNDINSTDAHNNAPNVSVYMNGMIDPLDSIPNTKSFSATVDNTTKRNDTINNTTAVDLPHAAATKFASLGFGVENIEGTDGENGKKYTGPIKLLKPLQTYLTWESENAAMIANLLREESELKAKQKKIGAEVFRKWNEERSASIASLINKEKEEMGKFQSGNNEKKSLSWTVVNKLIDTESLQRTKNTSRMKEIISKLHKSEGEKVQNYQDNSLLSIF